MHEPLWPYFKGYVKKTLFFIVIAVRIPNPTCVAVSAVALLLLFGFIQFLRITTVNFDMLKLNNPKFKSIADRCKPYTSCTAPERKSCSLLK
jgi:hypothetical protein